jgi:hypothetical protein
MKRKLTVLVPTALFIFAALSLLIAFTHLTSSPSFDFGNVKSSLHEWLPSGHSSASTTGKYQNRNKVDLGF